MIQEIEKMIELLLGSQQDGKFYVTDNITVKVEEKNGGTYLWIEDRSRMIPYGWIFNVEKTENGYKFCSDHDYIEECDTLEKVFDTVKNRKQ